MEEEYWNDEEYERMIDLQWEAAYEALYPCEQESNYCSEEELKELPF